MFIALHGPFGEDGTVQALLEAADLPYTGSGVAASALGMDKALFKRLCRGLGLPIIDWREIRERALARGSGRRPGRADGVLRRADDPRLMVKPAGLGSSVGMTLVHDPDELPGALDLAFRYDTLALVETYIAGARDLEVSVIGNDPAALELFGPGEIVAGHEFYDYAAKYTPGPVRDHDDGRGDAGPAGDDPQARARLRIGRSPQRGSRASTSCWPASGSSSRRSTRSRGSPRSASSRRSRPRAGTASPMSVRASSPSLIERHAARVRDGLRPADLPR